MAKLINKIPPPSQIITDTKADNGLIDQYWYDYLQGIDTRLADIETRLTALEDASLFRAPTFPTRIWIDNVAGNDANDGLTKPTAKRTPQGAVDHVIKHWHLNNNGIEFFYVANFSGGNPVEYPGAIWAYPFLGSPHDFAIRVIGETSGGLVQVRIADGSDGCIHAAEGAQIYVSDIAVRSTAAGAPALKAAYNGKLFVDNVVFYTGGGPLIEAGPRNSSIDVNGNITIIQFNAGASSTALTNAMDGGAISSAASTNWTFQAGGTPSTPPTFNFGILNTSFRGRQELRHTWVGSAVGRKWTMQSDGMFVTGHPGAAGLDAWVPGTIAGISLDGGAWPIL